MIEISDEIIASHLKQLKFTTRKDVKDASRWMYDGKSHTTEDYCRLIAQKLVYEYQEPYGKFDKIELESRIGKFLLDKYASGVKLRGKNQIAKSGDISLKNNITTIQGIEPTSVFNDEDRRLWNKFYYCEEDKCYYMYDGKRFSYVAPCVPSKPDEIRAFIREYARHFNKDFSDNFQKAVTDASKLSIALHNALKIDDESNVISSLSFKDIASMIDDEHKANPQLISEDYLMGLIVKDLFDSKTPSTIWRGFTQLQRRNIEASDPETDRKILAWNGFYAKTPNNVAVTISKYIENVLVNYGEELRDNLTILKTKPKFVSLKADVPAMNVLNEANLNEVLHAPKKNIKDTTLWNYLATLSEQQRKYVSAWCFNTIFRVKEEPIHLVLWDLGGTGKTSLLSQTIRAFTKRLYDNDYYYIKGEEFGNPTAHYDPLSNRDIADSMFCLIDDITTANLEAFSNATGSKNNTITCKKLYSNEYAKPNNTKFILATNYPLSVKRKDAFRRRIAIIHTYEANTWKIAQTDEEFMKCFNEDASTIIAYWKECYDTVIGEYGSLINAASQMSDIAPELDNATDVDENLDEALNLLFNAVRASDPLGGNTVKVSNAEWKTMLDKIIEDNHYLKGITSAQVRARLKQMKNVKVNQTFHNNGYHYRGIIVEFEPDITMDKIAGNVPNDDLTWANDVI